MAPEALNGWRQTDKRDAGELCLLVDYMLREHRDVFKVARAPSSAQERRRAQWRQRSLLKTRNMLAGEGWGLLQNWCPSARGGARMWSKLTDRIRLLVC